MGFGICFHYGFRGVQFGAALFQGARIFRISMRSKEVGTSQAPPAADEAQASEWQAPCERNRKGGANSWSQQRGERSFELSRESLERRFLL